MKLPRFSVRALLVFVAIICVAFGFVANQRRIISDRQAFIKNVWPNGWGRTQKDALDEGQEFDNDPITPIPIIRSLLGDEAYVSISIDAAAPQNLIEEAHDLFPEARIFRASGKEAEQIYPKQNSQN